MEKIFLATKQPLEKEKLFFSFLFFSILFYSIHGNQTRPYSMAYLGAYIDSKELHPAAPWIKLILPQQ